MTDDFGNRRSRDARVNASFLRPEVKLEPLVCRWHAWLALIAPATQAMNIAYRYLPNMKSFISNPAVHIAAARDPSMLGGPFLSLTSTDVDSVRDLAQRTTTACSKLLEFARDLREFDRRLQGTAKGGSLEGYYAELPSSLSGLMELVYDINNHPRIRLIEELLYDSELSGTATQEICLHTVPDPDRVFFMSTPMLEHHDRVFLRINFSDERLDELCSMRTVPGSLARVSDRLNVNGPSAEVFSRMFMSEAPVRRAPKYDGEDVRLRYFGHACVLIETNKTSVLLDPLTAWERDSERATLTFNDLPDFIDYVVITHAHQDHFVPEMLLQLRKRVGKIVVPRNDRGNAADPSMELVLRELGYTDVLVVDPMRSIELDEGEIVSLPFLGEHCDLDIASKHCVVVKLKGRTFAFLVDSDGVHPQIYRRAAPRVGKIDALFIGMECKGAPLTWLYGPLLSRPISRRDDDSRRLSGSNCERAWGILQELKSSAVFVYAMGQEPWLKYLMGLAYEPTSIQIQESNAFIEKCRANGIPAERLYGCRELLF